jgi:hypothetical protein
VDEEEVWLRRLQRSMEAVRDWEKCTGNPESVEPRSSLDKDDGGLPGHPVRSAAWYGLAAAVDHLALGADQTKDGLTVRPSSVFTVTRAALLGASPSVWVLSGRRVERQFRAMSIESDERKQHGGFVKDYAGDPFISEKLPLEFVAGLDDLSQRLTTEIQSLRSFRKGKPYDGDFVSTTMMREPQPHMVLAGSLPGRRLLRLPYVHRRCLHLR